MEKQLKSMMNIEHKQINFNIQAKPLTVNKAWVGGRRFRSPEYKSFEKEIAYFLPKITVKGEVEIRYKFYIKNYNRTDVSNLIKILEDILVANGIIEDDRFVKNVSEEKFKNDNESIQILINLSSSIIPLATKISSKIFIKLLTSVRL